MSLGFLISGLMLALCAACALRPLRGNGPLATASYVIGMNVNEMPIIWIALGLISLADGADWADPVALLASVLIAVAIGALVWSMVRAVRFRDVPLRALDDALGAGWRDRISPDLRAGLPTRVPVGRGLLLPFLRWRAGLVRSRNIAYGPAGRRNRLDIIRAKEARANAPVFIHFHGGRFRSGDKGRESLPMLRHLARRGWVCVSATYRLGRDAAFPDAVVDAKRVVAWVRAHRDELGIDAERVVVAGNSAGGYLAMFTGLTPCEARFQPGFEDADTSVAATIGLYGYYGSTKTGRPDSAPAAHLHELAPPMMLLHGDRDSFAPVEGAREFARHARQASKQPVAYAELPGAQHTFDYFRSVRAESATIAVDGFAAWATCRLDSHVHHPAERIRTK